MADAGNGHWRGVLALLLAAGLGLAAPLRAAQLPAQVQRVLTHYAIPADSLGIYVHEIGASEPAFVHRADVPRNPASTMKLVTTFAALELLGPGYQWTTELVAEGPVADGVLDGDLRIRGGGDPYLVAERLWLLQRRLRGAGVRHIRGDLVFDGAASAFAQNHDDPGAFDGQPYRTYNVQPSPLLLNFQSVVFRFRADAVGGPVAIDVDPPLANLRIDNRLSAGPGPCRGYQRGIAFETRESDDELVAVFSGTFPAACAGYAMRRAMRSADAFNYGLFKALWEESGGRLDGGFRRAAPGVPPTPGVPAALAEGSAAVRAAGGAGGRLLVRFESPPLAEVIRAVNKHSNNVMARHLLLTIGAQADGPSADARAGARAVERWLAGIGLAMPGLYIDNGAGLSRDARISAHQLGAMLLYAGRQSLWQSELVASMPVSAIDGTLRDRFDGRLAGRLHMKTGSLDDVSALAGYVSAPSGRRYVVVVIMNHENAHRGPGEEAQEALLGWLLANEPAPAAGADCAPVVVSGGAAPDGPGPAGAP